MILRTRIPAASKVVFHWLGIGLMLAGACGIAVFVWVKAEAWIYQECQEALLEQPRPPQAPAPVLSKRVLSVVNLARDPLVLGRLEIPRIGVKVMVREGMDERTLRRAAGHLPGSALPGQRGNSVIAAHRDTFFRPLRHVRRGDLLRFVAPRQTFHYVVDSIMVVAPDAGEVLEPAPDTRFTLITCFPFDYVGAAPRRFVVSAIERPLPR